MSGKQAWEVFAIVLFTALMFANLLEKKGKQ